MTNRITLAAREVRIGDHIYNGPSGSNHPTFAWETVTRIDNQDGLLVLITGNPATPHGEFWFEPEEEVVVIRYPPAEAAKPVEKAHGKHGHGHT